jgi:hypothetical protein
LYQYLNCISATPANTVSPETLPDRLRAAGFHDVDVEVRDGRQRWRSVNA